MCQQNFLYNIEHRPLKNTDSVINYARIYEQSIIKQNKLPL